MIKRIHIAEYLSGNNLLPLIDVRTPAEYTSGHIPGAVNIPLFSNEERAKVGTVYTRESHSKAYDLGYAYVNPKLEYFAEASKKVAEDGKTVVYCWRGGMRSKSFAEHIEQNGINEVSVIEGGYKAFRNYALDTFQNTGRIQLLGGYTGSGKTRILKQLFKLGEQVIDLEALANHKGSAFGSIGQDPQPPNEHFSNLLFWKWKELDFSKTIWLEDESIHIGKVYLPQNLFQRMREAEVYFLNISKELRAQLLVEEYVGTEKEPLKESIRKISKRLGGLKTTLALEALERDDYFETAMISLDYYDKFYLKGLERRNKNKVVIIDSETIDDRINAETIIKQSRMRKHA